MFWVHLLMNYKEKYEMDKNKMKLKDELNIWDND